MKFKWKINKTALIIAVEKMNSEAVKFLLEHPNIDVNSMSISIKNFLNIISNKMI